MFRRNFLVDVNVMYSFASTTRGKTICMQRITLKMGLGDSNLFYPISLEGKASLSDMANVSPLESTFEL